jgi:hypothetical protein
LHTDTLSENKKILNNCMDYIIGLDKFYALLQEIGFLIRDASTICKLLHIYSDIIMDFFLSYGKKIHKM